MLPGSSHTARSVRRGGRIAHRGDPIRLAAGPTRADGRGSQGWTDRRCAGGRADFAGIGPGAVPAPDGDERSPHLRMTRVGRSAFRPLGPEARGSLTTDGCMCGRRRGPKWPAGGWRSHTRSRDSRVGASFARRAIGPYRRPKPWRNGQRARLSLGRMRVRVPSASWWLRATLRTSWATCPWGFESLRRH